MCPLPRSQGRQELALSKDLPFQGVDVWHNYEASWLNAKGKPQVAIVQLLVPCTSIFLIESKSLKLYFNSLNFKTVTCIDPHSSSLECCLKNFKSIDNSELLKFALQDIFKNNC